MLCWKHDLWAVSTVLVHAIVGGAVGAGAQAASNLVEGKPLGDGVLTAAVIGGVTGGISGGMAARQAAKAGGALSAEGLLPSLFRRASKGILQRVTKSVNAEFVEDATKVAGELSQAELAQGRRSFWGMTVTYGKAVERGVARRVENSRFLDSLFEHAGGASEADFYGKGLFKGGIYDITTAAKAASKNGKYGKYTLAVTYNRARGLWRLP